MGSSTYSCDANGTMTDYAGQTLTYDTENRLTAVTGSHNTSFSYDNDGE